MLMPSVILIDLVRIDPDCEALVGGRVVLQQRVLDHHPDPEADEDAGERIRSERAVEDATLGDVPHGRHHHEHEDHRPPDAHPHRRAGRQRQVGGEHGEIAVGEIDEPHHAERQRQPGGEQRVETAEQNPLHDRVDPLHQPTPKYAAVIADWSTSPTRPESDTRPSSMQ